MPIPTILEDVRAVQDEMIALRRRIHSHPELGFEEHVTSELVAGRLKQWGYRVARGVGKTGVVGSLTVGDGPRRVGLRADMDALPIQELTGAPHASQRAGLMHACGHDGHTATLLAAARVLALTCGFHGTLNVIFQPAEEGRGGAQAMLDDGLFERFPCDRLFGFHNSPGAPAGHFGFRAGVVYTSSDTVVIKVIGRGGHGAKPHLAVDPIVAAAHVVVALQSIVSREVDPNETAIVTVGAFIAGEAPNVIPDHAELRLTVRTRSEALRLKMRERITAVAQTQAAVHGASAEVNYRMGYPVTINDEESTAFAREVARELAGDAALVPNWPPGTASEDIGLMLQRVPGCYFNVGNGAEGEPGASCQVHNARYDFNDRILPSTASLFVRLVQRYLV